MARCRPRRRRSSNILTRDRASIRRTHGSVPAESGTVASRSGPGQWTAAAASVSTCGTAAVCTRALSPGYPPQQGQYAQQGPPPASSIQRAQRPGYGSSRELCFEGAHQRVAVDNKRAKDGSPSAVYGHSRRCCDRRSASDSQGRDGARLVAESKKAGDLGGSAEACSC